MKETLTKLVREDIRTTRLVRTLASVDIDANDYMSANSEAVFCLLELDSKGEDFTDLYYTKVETAAEGNKMDDLINAQNIILWLSGLSKVSI